MALFLVACGNARPAPAAQATATGLCVACHGGADNATGAPPTDLQRRSDTTLVSVGAHTSHVTAGPMSGALACTECHPGTTFTSPTHRNGTVDLAWGPVAGIGGASNWDRISATCGVYCHGSAALGGTVPRPTWTRVDGSQSACGACHGLPPPAHPALVPGSTVGVCSACHAGTVKPDGTIDVAGGLHVNGRVDGFAGHPAGWALAGSPESHAAPARADVNACLACHAPAAPPRVTTITCDACHREPASGDYAFTCTSCHGSSANAAPPRDTRGNVDVSAVGVGAHQSHVAGTHGVAAPLACEACHVKPASAFDPTHMDGVVEVTGYTGTDPALLAVVKDPGWSPGPATCATAYCHGGTLGGGAATRPVWTRVDGSQSACGSCHGLPPPRHPALAAGTTLATCGVCHPQTVRPDGAIDVASGAHVNGVADGFAGHGAGWTTVGDANFHGTAVGTLGVTSCWSCHAAKAPATVSAVTCASCHDALAGGVDWTTSCFGCHGTLDRNIGPPRDVHGNTATTAIGVGAHQSHVTAPGGLTAPLDCAYCHQKPANVFDAGHLDGRAQVTGYTGADPVRKAAMTDPGWSATTATCATSWCHGGYSGTYSYQRDDGSGALVTVDVPFAGTPRSPLWTLVDGTQGACGTCHGVPPANGSWHSGNHGGLNDFNACSLCHAGVRADGSGFTDPARHVNGQVDVDARFVSACFGCH